MVASHFEKLHRLYHVTKLTDTFIQVNTLNQLHKKWNAICKRLWNL